MDQVQAILSVRGGEDLRMDGMIKLLRKERFAGLMDGPNAYVPPESAPMSNLNGINHNKQEIA